VYINGKLITPSNNLYGYEAYLETVLSNSTTTKLNELKCSLYYGDIKDFNDVTHTGNDYNTGAKARFENTKYSKLFEVYGGIHCGLFQQDNLLIPNSDIKIILKRVSENFCLMSAATHADARDTYSIVIDTAHIRVRKVKVSDSIRLQHESMLLKKNALYPFRSVDLRFYAMSGGRMDLSVPTLFQGVLPRRVLLGVVETSAFSGHLNKNPLEFKHCNISSIVLKRDGIPIPFESIELKPTKNIFYQGYYSLLHACGVAGKNLDIGIPPEAWMKGYSIFGFDLSADNSPGSPVFERKVEGQLSVEILLDEQQSEAVTLIAYFEFDKVMEIRADRSIII
jgi:ribonucleoside-diphosphate reductase beta chain